MLLEATITPLTTLPTAHPSPEAIRSRPVARRPASPAVGAGEPRFTIRRAARRVRALSR
jgi:hypothetical protein